jgi:hypothetical protein
LLAAWGETATTIRDRMAAVSDSQARRQTSAAINVAAVKCDGIRRQLRASRDRAGRSAAAFPGWHAVCAAGVSA